jgi:NADPH-dependent curcumin reductase CurA
MSIPSETKVYILANPPTGAIKSDTFKLETRPLPKESELQDGELLLKTIALSNDPAQRTWMTKDVDEVSLVHYVKRLVIDK